MTRSPQLRDFVAQAPIERELILGVVTAAATSAPEGARVLDAGAGDAPYRELFAHTEYMTTDWEGSVHTGARSADIIASLDALPVPDASFDVVLCTQVLEHVPEPAVVLSELRRVLRDGGELWLTVPFVGELHEEPHDHYRYTSHGLRGLCERAGFGQIETWPLGGYFTTMAQLARNCGPATGVGTDSGELGRRLLAAGFRAIARLLPPLDRLDHRRALPIGFACRAVAQPASTRS